MASCTFAMQQFLKQHIAKFLQVDLSALITLSLWLSPRCKWRQDANSKHRLLDELPFEFHAEWGGSQARSQPLALTCPGQLSPQLSHSCALADALYSQELCFPSHACLWCIAGIK